MSNQHGIYLVLLHGRPRAAHDTGTRLIGLTAGAVFFTEGLQKFLFRDVRGAGLDSLFLILAGGGPYSLDAVRTGRDRGTVAPS